MLQLKIHDFAPNPAEPTLVSPQPSGSSPTDSPDALPLFFDRRLLLILSIPFRGTVRAFSLRLCGSAYLWLRLSAWSAAQASLSVSNPVSRTVPGGPIRPHSRTIAQEPNRVSTTRMA